MYRHDPISAPNTPCSDYAATAWNTATGENLNDRESIGGFALPVSTPRMLQTSIRTANGGTNWGVGAQTTVTTFNVFTWIGNLFNNLWDAISNNPAAAAPGIEPAFGEPRTPAPSLDTIRQP